MLELVNPCHQEAVVDVHAFQIVDLRALNGELCKTCLTFHPTMICLTETHLCQDVTDTVCPAG